MLTDYLNAAMHAAHYELIEGDAAFYAEIPGFQGVFANAATLEACRDELREVLEEWVLLRVSRKLALPAVDGLELRITEIAKCRRSGPSAGANSCGAQGAGLRRTVLRRQAPVHDPGRCHGARPQPA